MAKTPRPPRPPGPPRRPRGTFNDRFAKATAPIASREGYSYGVRGMTVTLNMAPTHNLISVYWEDVRKALYDLVQLSRRVTDGKKNIIIDIVTAELNKMNDALVAEQARQDEIIEKDPDIQDFGPSSFPMKRDVPLEYTTPYAKRYIRLLVELDKVLATFEALWIEDLIPQDVRFKQEDQWKNRFANMSRSFVSLRDRSRAAAEKKDGAEEVAKLIGSQELKVEGPLTEHRASGATAETTTAQDDASVDDSAIPGTADEAAEDVQSAETGPSTAKPPAKARKAKEPAEVV